MTIDIDASRLSCFSDRDGANLVILTDRQTIHQIAIRNSAGYSSVDVRAVSADDLSQSNFWCTLPARCLLLAMVPSAYFRSPSPTLLGPDRQLAVMPCHSTPEDSASIAYFVRQAALSDALAQERFADRFYTQVAAATALQVLELGRDNVAVFRHRGLQWNEQAGPLGWGQQQLFPSGEISALATGVYDGTLDHGLDITGCLRLRCRPILHSGSVSFLRSDQTRIYERLRALETYAITARVVHGEVLEWQPEGPEGRDAANMLNALCVIDGRFKYIVEIGIGLNTSLVPLAGNHAMNEVYGGASGAVHFGFGLLPHTQYHLDLICPDIAIVNENGEHIVGKCP
jgi:hypothetical protein